MDHCSTDISRWLRGAFIRYFSKIQASGEATELVSSVGCSAGLGSHTILTILQWWKVKDLQLTVGNQGTVDGTVDVQKKHSSLDKAFRKISLVLGMWNALLITSSLQGREDTGKT